MVGCALPHVEHGKLGAPPIRDHRPSRGKGLAGAGAQSTTAPRQVLIVEDEAIVALTIEAMVQDIGHAVVAIASDARSAFRLALKLPHDLVLMDVRLGAAGDEGIAAAAAITARTGAPIVFVTAHADPAILARIKATVPTARVLTKPINALELAQAIEEATLGS